MALSLSGSGQYLTVTPAIISSYPMSIGAWINQTANTGNQDIVSISEAANTDMFLLYLAGGSPRCAIKFSGTFASASAGVISLGVWVHVVGVFASATSRIIYVNGINRATNATSGTPTGVTNTQIGAQTTGTGDYFNGSIAYPTIWNTALSATDVTNLYNSGSGVDPRTIQAGNIVSFSILQSGPPYPDSVTSVNWTVTGSPTVVADPFSVATVIQLSGTCTARAANTGILRATKKLSGTSAGRSLNSGLITPPPVLSISSEFPSMVWSTIGAQAIVLMLLPPNFSTPIKVTLSVMDMAQVTQNNKSSTRSLSSKGRYTIEMECLAGNLQESSDIRAGLNRLKGELVALPLWTDAVSLTTLTVAGDTTSTFNSSMPPSRWGTWWAFINLTTFVYELVSVTSVSGSTITTSSPSFTWPVGSVLVPLIFGRFSLSSPPTFTKLTESVNTIKFVFEENSPFTFALNPFPTTLGVVQTNLGLFSAARLWNVPCTYAGSEIDNVVVDIDYERIGFQRQDAAFVYPQAPRRVTELAFEVCDRKTIAAIESCFIDRQGRAFNLWVPTFRNDVDLIENLPDSTPTHILVDGSSRYLDTNFTGHPGFPYLCLNDNTGQAIFPIKTASLSGNTIVTTVPVTQTFLSNSKISHLILSRFQDNSISWTYATDGFANTTIKWVEATEDYANTQYEQSISQLFIFTNQNLGGLTSWYFTNFESDIVVGSNTYLSAPMSHGIIKTGLDMASDEAEIVSFQFANNPLNKLMPWHLVGSLLANIYDFDRVTLAPTLIFAGTVEEINTEASKITAKVMGFGGLYDQQFHRHVMASDCPYSVYSPECGAARVPTGVIITSSIGTTVSVVPALSIPVDAFAKGIIEVVSGGTYNMVEISNSSVPISGHTQLGLIRPLIGSVVGAFATLSIGCDGSFGNCAILNNTINYGGENNIPTTNPSIQAVQPRDSAVSKK